MNEREFNRLLKRVCYDKEAFVRLYRFYYPRIILYIAKECPEADAEAVGQEFFIRLIKIVNPGCRDVRKGGRIVGRAGRDNAQNNHYVLLERLYVQGNSAENGYEGSYGKKKTFKGDK